MVMQLALTQRNGVRFPGGARGSYGNRKISRAQTSRSARSNRAFRTQCLFVQLAGRRILVPVIVVRIHGRQLCRRARLAAPPSYGGRPGSTPGGGSTCSYSNSGREGGPRSRLLRVRLPPSTPGICGQIHACLVATASTLPRYGSSRGSTPRAGSHADVARPVTREVRIVGGAGSNPVVRSM